MRRLAVRASGEIRIADEAGAKRDVAAQVSETVSGHLDQVFGQVITVPGRTNGACPVFFRATERCHWDVPDPSTPTGSEEERAVVFRAARDAMGYWIEREPLER
jgi:hypothetical protein